MSLPTAPHLVFAPGGLTSPDGDLRVLLDGRDIVDGLRRWAVFHAQSPDGGYVAWLDHDTGQPAFEYPEITGYALTYIAGLSDDAERRVSELRAGERSAEWLISRIEDDRLAPRADWGGQSVCNFDLAMMANGLMVFGLRVDREEIVAHGLGLTRRLLDQIDRHGHLRSVDPAANSRLGRSTWSTEGFAHLTKTAQCLLTADALGLAGAKEAAGVVVRKGLEGQRPDGRIVTHPDDRETMLHPHLYAVEGLWVYGVALDDAVVLDRARRAAEWAWGQALANGGLPRFVSTTDGSRGPEQFDVTAQAVRSVLLTNIDADVSPSVRRLCSVALPAGQGALAMPYDAQTGPQHRNVWSTMFAAQACGLADGDPLDWRYLV